MMIWTAVSECERCRGTGWVETGVWNGEDSCEECSGLGETVITDATGLYQNIEEVRRDCPEAFSIWGQDEG